MRALILLFSVLIGFQMNIVAQCTPPYVTLDQVYNCNSSALLHALAIPSDPATSIISYQWMGPCIGYENANYVEVFCMGMYSVVVTDDLGCTNSADVFVDNFMELQIVGKNPICVGDSSMLTAEVWGSGNYSTYKWSTDETAQSIQVKPATTTNYTVTVTDDGYGCSLTDEITVMVYPCNLSVSVSALNSSVCLGDSAQIQAHALGGNGPYVYAWSNGVEAVSFTAAPALSTTYTVTVTDGDDHIATSAVAITVKALPVADAGADKYIVSGQTTTLNAGGGELYQWNTSATNASIELHPLETTTYTVTVSNNGCTDRDEAIVYVMDAFIQADQSSICIGNTTHLTAMPSSGKWPYTFLWNTGEDSNTIAVSPDQNAVYTVTITDSNNATLTSNIAISVFEGNPLAMVDRDVTIFKGQSITLHAFGGESYVWRTGQEVDSITVSPVMTTTYFVSVVNACGFDTDKIVVSVQEFPAHYSIHDIDNNTYSTALIGDQVWMGENLKVLHLNDGASVPNTTNDIDWINLATPGFCWYNNDKYMYGDKYGALYNWYAVNTGKLCPTGWHVPTDDEWTSLSNHLGGEAMAGTKLKESGTASWMSPNEGATNETQFTALPGGYRVYTDGTFYHVKMFGNFWTSSQYTPDAAFDRTMHYQTTSNSRGGGDKGYGFSVRCMKNYELFLPLSVSVVASNKICTESSSMLQTEILSGNGNYGYYWNTGATTANLSVSPTSTTDYAVTISDAMGLTATASVTVDVLNCVDYVYTQKALALLGQADEINANDLDTCLVNYTEKVDSAKVIGMEITGDKSALIEWAFWQQGVKKTFVSETVFYQPGWRLIYQTVICGSQQKSQNSVTFVDAINIVITNMDPVAVALFELYPNPAKTDLALAFHQPGIDATVQILNAMGQKVYGKRWEHTNNTEVIDISALAEGIYFIVVKADSQSLIKKFVKE